MTNRYLKLFLATAVSAELILGPTLYGANFSALNESWTNIPTWGSRGTFFADVTGDKRADLILVNDNWITVRPSDGKFFVGNAQWTNGPYYGSQGTFFADVTGDGKADAIKVTEDGIIVRRSSGTKFGSDESWTNGPYYGSRGAFFADVTGDGKADAIKVTEDGIIVRRSSAEQPPPPITGDIRALVSVAGSFSLGSVCPSVVFDIGAQSLSIGGGPAGSGRCDYVANFGGLSPGNYTVVARTLGWRACRSTTVIAGKVVDVFLTPNECR